MSEYYKERFWCRVYESAIDIDGNCPNRDGLRGDDGVLLAVITPKEMCD